MNNTLESQQAQHYFPCLLASCPECAKQLISMIDGASACVELFNAETKSQHNWKKEWLAKHKEIMGIESQTAVTTPEWDKQDSLAPQVSDLYIQQVNTAQLVLHLRGAVEAALKNGMQFATAIGTLHLMIREVGDWAIAEMESENA